MTAEDFCYDAKQAENAVRTLVRYCRQSNEMSFRGKESSSIYRPFKIHTVCNFFSIFLHLHKNEDEFVHMVQSYINTHSPNISVLLQ